MLQTDFEILHQYSACHRLWQGIPSIECTEKGRLFSAFYSGGTTEQLGNYCVLLKSDDGGDTWSEPIAAADAGGSYRCYDPCLWIDPLGRLWFIWAVMPDHAVWASLCDHPDADDLHWSPPRIIGHDVMMNKPIIASTGEWLFPMAVWDEGVLVISECPTPQQERGSFVYRSYDQGQSFQKIGGADVKERSFDEHMLLEKYDGALWMLVRTRYGIGQSYSYDGGCTWTPGEDSGLGGPCSRFQIRRLTSGNLLLVNHHHFQGRNNLTALLSQDDGKTWDSHLLLDERSSVSYPDVTERDGYLYITYDRERGAAYNPTISPETSAREILFAKITEADILAGSLVHTGSFLKRIISKLGDYDGPDPRLQELNCKIPRYVSVLARETSGEAIVSAILRDYGRCCVNLHHQDTDTVDACIAKLLERSMADDIYAKSATIQQLITILLANEKAPSAPVDMLMEEVFEYVRMHLPQEITLDAMASALHISKFYLCHIFKRKTGITLMQYVLNRRITTAKQLLSTTRYSVTEISVRVGYNSAAYFAKLFKDMTGVSPSQYRESMEQSK
ncbi:exo-alpha-sialidase [Bianquea renquensis]|uniref:Exo-alpha-sialidase n=1 Tax=Bianquea renquensis TaxID=2763661 RepID=A0A926DUY2_9FIRM|nr:exo-alpha-sialidase [Bianquea renquensis]MBC8544164.1 exo-alpha-sialidase [Bianquea renquensis]